ncbi:MAG: glucose 1-dehydrogenase [Dehalococcoidales bacterium]|nr:glucose 1-dehydrogenase [Dehalococcoidales bacterium]
MRFEGKVALVTGGASGIGRVTAQVFGREGAKVVIATDKNTGGAEETVRLIREAGGEATFIPCDVSKAADVESLIARSVETYGKVDFAFNNAGIGPDGKRVPVVPVAEMPEELWERTININLTGVFYCMKYEIRQMQKQKYGAIVNTSSVGAYKAVPGFSAYDASKIGLFGLTKAAALENATRGIRINIICPGPTLRTQLIENLTGSIEGQKERMVEMLPMKRMAEPEEMAEAVMFLCSDAASYITGHALPVDGGMTSV